MNERKNRIVYEMKAMADIAQDEQDHILEDHSRDLTRVENALDAEKVRQKNAVRERLAKRRRVAPQRFYHRLVRSGSMVIGMISVIQSTSVPLCSSSTICL